MAACSRRTAKYGSTALARGDLVEEAAEIAQENGVRTAALRVSGRDGSGQAGEEIWDRRETDLGDGGHGLHGLGQSTMDRARLAFLRMAQYRWVAIWRFSAADAWSTGRG
jgi:hypothetical protein